jgi:hypothetical protein
MALQYDKIRHSSQYQADKIGGNYLYNTANQAHRSAILTLFPTLIAQVGCKLLGLCTRLFRLEKNVNRQAGR